MNKLYKFKDGKRVRALSDISCPICKKVFPPRTSKDVYCSRKCYYEMKKLRGDKVYWTNEMKEKMSEKYKGEGNPMFGKESWCKGKKRPEMSLENHPLWKGGFWISKDGYKILQNSSINDGNKTAEHRKVVEDVIGKKLLETDIVHHINGNKLDNRIENLCVMTRTEHINEHREDLNNGRK